MNRTLLLCASVPLWLTPPLRAEPLPGTKPLTATGDLARTMVDGLHAYLDRELAASVEGRKQFWHIDTSSPDAYAKSVAPNRDRLRTILGVVDPRLPPRLEYVGGPDAPLLVAATDRYKVYAVRWAVLPGVDGEGLLLEPAGKTVANVVALPDADQTPEQVTGLAAGVPPLSQFARRLAENGCRVIVPVLIDRKDDYSGNPKLNRATNQPHREFVHRMAYEMGRTLIGYEVQKVLSAIDWFCRDKDHPPVGVVGFREGAVVGFHAAVLDPRVKVVHECEYFGPREQPHREPIYRNVWGYVSEFGNSHAALLLGGRLLLLDPGPWEVPVAPPPAKPGRAGAAPSEVLNPAIPPGRTIGGDIYSPIRPRLYPDSRAPLVWTLGHPNGEWLQGRLWSFFNLLLLPERTALTQWRGELDTAFPPPKDRRPAFDPAARQKRQFDQLVAHTQKLWRDSDATRKRFWAKADASSPEKWEPSCEWYRRYFHEEVIGKLPDPTMPLNPRTRRVYDTPKWTGHEVVLDVYPDVIASGILLLPKDLKPGERRPVVVCQHGLEGRPADVCNPAERTKYYNSFGAQLADRGYVVYAPQNPYIFENHFRQLQRKANPLKLSLFSFIIAQHTRSLDWLEGLPQVDPKRIAFYGLSYGGKTAMRVPAVEQRYCLSICSGDFNEWVGKNVSVDLGTSYMWTREYEMYEFDLGNTFNYAEMAYLIAPRPFMVERGHDDGVGIDEMVAYEYAKVRYLYANKLKLPDRAAIEFFPGGHEINGKGTFAFLQRHLRFPE